MTSAIAAEYEALAAEAVAMRDAAIPARRRAASRLRRELHRIQARDYFPMPSGDNARRAVENLAVASTVKARA